MKLLRLSLILASTLAHGLGCSDDAPRADRGLGKDAALHDLGATTRNDRGAAGARDAAVRADTRVSVDARAGSAPAVGDACSGDTTCPTSCLTAQAYGFPGGYCSAQCCGNAAACGQGSHCGAAVQNFAFCLRDCASAADCRQAASYVRFDSDNDGKKECMPQGSGSGVVGASCATTADCAGGQHALCATATNGGFVGGYCSIALCQASPQETCPTGSHCVDHSVAGRRAACGKSCVSNPDCRASGYACYDADRDGKKECAAAAARHRLTRARACIPGLAPTV
ncbi:MAG: hypothetical protein IPL40_08090 [Proteobacteria bacterium]|nr:hypothetical protein [Pseudomonadota bacterium]